MEGNFTKTGTSMFEIGLCLMALHSYGHICKFLHDTGSSPLPLCAGYSPTDGCGSRVSGLLLWQTSSEVCSPGSSTLPCHLKVPFTSLLLSFPYLFRFRSSTLRLLPLLHFNSLPLPLHTFVSLPHLVPHVCPLPHLAPNSLFFTRPPILPTFCLVPYLSPYLCLFPISFSRAAIQASEGRRGERGRGKGREEKKQEEDKKFVGSLLLRFRYSTLQHKFRNEEDEEEGDDGVETCDSPVSAVYHCYEHEERKSCR